MSLLSKWGFNRKERTAICLLAAALIAGIAVSEFRQYRFEAQSEKLSADDSTLIEKLNRRTEAVTMKSEVQGTSEPVPSAAEISFPLDLNTAAAEQLEALPGIGPVLAQRIVRYRQSHGTFNVVDSLINVPGIGAERLKKIRSKITVKSP